jgi:cytoskeleton protein RodZ
MMANSAGEQLKQARLERGLTLEQVAQVTRIRVVYLQALENDQRETLPSAVQGKGFLRLYAGHLNLPLEPLLALWDGKVPAVTPTVVEPSTAAAPTPLASSDDSAEIELPPVQFVSAAQDNSVPINEDPPLPGSSHAIFREIGQKLRQQREILGLSQAEVERYTHLRQHYIQAMEDGNQAGLPSPVQGRGMLSNYAAFLNMSEDALLLRYAEALQARRTERIPKKDTQPLFSSKKRPARQAPFWRRFLTPDLVFGVGLAAAILFFVLWTASRITALRSEDSPPTPPAISEILLNPDIQQTTTVDALTAVGAVSSGSSEGQIEEESTSVITTPLATAAPSRTPAPLSLAPINNDPLQVYIVARQRAWLRVITDDKVKFAGRVVPGNAYAFSASRQIEVLTGNAAAIQVFYNQTDMGALGIVGEVAGLIFTQEGILTPTAVFTPTALATQIPTVTPLPTATPQSTPTVTPFVP